MLRKLSANARMMLRKKREREPFFTVTTDRPLLNHPNIVIQWAIDAMRALIPLSVLLLLVGTANAGFFEDFGKQMNEKLNDATDWVKDVAAPAISEKASEVSATVQDPETHRSIKNWFVEKYDAAADFANNKVVPELKKAYDNAAQTLEPADD